MRLTPKQATGRAIADAGRPTAGEIFVPEGGVINTFCGGPATVGGRGGHVVVAFGAGGRHLLTGATSPLHGLLLITDTRERKLPQTGGENRRSRTLGLPVMTDFVSDGTVRMHSVGGQIVSVLNRWFKTGVDNEFFGNNIMWCDMYVCVARVCVLYLLAFCRDGWRNGAFSFQHGHHQPFFQHWHGSTEGTFSCNRGYHRLAQS